MRINDVGSECPADLVKAGIAADMAILARPERDDSGGVAARRTLARATVADSHCPLPVQVHVIADVVEIPGTDARGTTADLGKLEPFGAEEPLHVRGRGLD